MKTGAKGADMRKLAIVAIAAVLVVAGCGSSGGGSSSKNTLKVDVDGKDAVHNEAFLHYFPKALTAHPGDSVQFTNQGNGEPHTVPFGTLVAGAVSEAAPD